MSRVLVDTHALLWWLVDDAALSATAREALADPTAEPLVSTASVWEIAIKRSLGKLTAPDDLPERIAARGSAGLRSALRTPGASALCPHTTVIRSTACSSRRRSSRTCP